MPLPLFVQIDQLVLPAADADGLGVFERVDAVARLHAFDQMDLALVGRPVSDLFGAILSRIQILMLQQDIERLQDPTFIPDGSNTVYCIFMIIGIVGYFCVPTVASWIIQAGGAGSYGDKVAGAGRAVAMGAAGVAGAAVGNVGGRIKGALKKR